MQEREKRKAAAKKDPESEAEAEKRKREEARQEREQRKAEREGSIGQRIRVWWNADEFCDGTIVSYGGDGGYIPEARRGKHLVKYDNGEEQYEKLFGRRGVVTWEELPDKPTKKKKVPPKKSTGFDLGRG